MNFDIYSSYTPRNVKILRIVKYSCLENEFMLVLI